MTEFVRGILAVFTVLSGVWFASAQPIDTVRAYFEVTDAESVATGSPFTMVLNIVTPPLAEVTMPELEGRWGDDYSVLSTVELPVNSDGPEWLYQLEIQVVAWGMGEMSTPLTRVEVLVGGNIEEVVVEPYFLEVPSVLDEIPELRVSRSVLGLADPIDAWVIGLMTSVLVVVAASVGVFVQKTRFRQPRLLNARLQRTTHERTLQALNRLEADAPDRVVQYAALGDILRHYVTEVFDLEPGKTTSDVLDHVGQLNVDENRLRELEYLLKQSDLAKFAPRSVLDQEDKPLIRLAKRWVGALHQEQGAE
jgi:hypothetical protein